ncbi:hypothetical protein KIW84_071679 [Lathyrus oleraceus]|uniref:Uncharacterized protein n=1 Tax=Pisum sativum TaxID=3888 RepID=A0A9D4ZV32_PEA|nr:hypothetical protein KIW84_071679 [Pisum sativum]
MENASSCPTPMVTGKQFTAEGERLKDPTVFRQAIEALQYLTNTRPDIAFSVNNLSQFMSSLTIDHWQGIKRLKQKVVSRSSIESEYRALADLAAEIAWTRSLLDELKLPLPRKPTLWCDNLSAKALASNPVMHARSKHIEIDVHYIRDQVLQNEIVVAYVPSAVQIVDCLTKALTHTRFNQLKDKLGVTSSPISLKVGIRDKIP